ncbi:YneF family protein, partial [Bacillus pumilus]|uniref:YneF family protein n=1 Tax=Bacillus pumilus TaxID=1408 RepID=UPI0021B53B99
RIVHLSLVILLPILALLARLALPFFIPPNYIITYFKNNPPINQQILRIIIIQMPIKPSHNKINQIIKHPHSSMNKKLLTHLTLSP